MRLRNQILVPLVAIQGIGVLAIALATATLAARRSEQQIVTRINGVIEVLGRSNFPATSSVLERMHSLSGAHFIARPTGEATVETSLGAIREPLPDPSSFPTTARLDILSGAEEIELAGLRYVAIAVGSARLPKLLILYPEASWRQARWEAAWPPLALGVVMLGFMIAVTGWVAHAISSRIRRVQGQVATIAGGDFQEIEPAGPHDEVDELTRSINQMSVQLRDMAQTIEQTERTRLISQLAAGLAHQLRNSLTGARMGVQLHLRRSPGCRQDGSLDVVLRQLSVTEDQVRGLLALGRNEVNPHEQIDLNALLTEVAILVGPAAEHTNVTIEHAVEPASVWIPGDPSGLRAAVLNLTLNAIESSRSGGSVKLLMEQTFEHVTIIVCDDGLGPPRELADHLLDPFVTSKPEGVGLGLAVAARVAEVHGGLLDWKRDQDWTVFRLHLPIRPETKP